MATVVAIMALMAATLVGHGGASAAPAQQGPELPDGPGRIEIIQTPSGGGGICLPPALGLRHAVINDATTFRLRITVVAPLCSRVNAVAAIYAMPGNGVAWPQQLVTTTPFTLREPGVTEVIFHKGCDPVQFDVITGATPPTIAPWGPWHGPLLFPFDLNTSLQWWGCIPPPTTTTTTTQPTTTTTTIVDPCDDYTPTDLAVSPSTATPGTTLTVTGSGVPGTLIQVLLRPPAGDGDEGDGVVVVASPDVASFVALSDPALVGEDGRWSTTVIVPSDAVPGTWTVAAQAVGCETEVTSEVQVVEGTTTTQTPTTEPPEVAGLVDVADVPPEALSAGVGSNGGGAAAAGLAFTGSSTHIPIVAGIVLLCAGGLLLLSDRRRRRS